MSSIATIRRPLIYFIAGKKKKNGNRPLLQNERRALSRPAFENEVRDRTRDKITKIATFPNLSGYTSSSTSCHYIYAISSDATHIAKTPSSPIWRTDDDTLAPINQEIRASRSIERPRSSDAFEMCAIAKMALVIYLYYLFHPSGLLRITRRNLRFGARFRGKRNE